MSSNNLKLRLILTAVSLGTTKGFAPLPPSMETIRRDSFEYPMVSKFVAPPDFWLNFVAPVSASHRQPAS